MKNMEMKIYESLGIKKFRKMVMKILDICCFIISPSISKKERQKILRQVKTNYTIGTIHSLEDIKDYKHYIKFNTFIHASALIALMPYIINDSSLASLIFHLSLIVINSYCIMLQRYNNIKINQLISKMQPKYENQKKKLIGNVKTLNNKLSKHKYILIKKEKEIKDITFDEIINNSSYKELLIYRDYLKSLSDCEDNNISYEECIIPLNKDKALILKK